MKKDFYLVILKVFLSLSFFFVFWTGVIYLTDVISGEEKFLMRRFVSALGMAILFTYFTDCGARFFFNGRKKKNRF